MDNVTFDGEKTGRNAARYVAGDLKKQPQEITVLLGENIRTVTPHRIVGTESAEIAVRVERPIENAELMVGKYRKKYRVLSPTEVIKVTLKPSDLETCWECGELTVSCSERRKEKAHE